MCRCPSCVKEWTDQQSGASAAEEQSLPPGFIHIKVRWFNGAEGDDWREYVVVGPSLDDVVTSAAEQMAPGFIDRVRWNAAKQLAHAFGSTQSEGLPS